MTKKPPEPITQRSFSMPDDPIYWQTLGQFIETFALTELVLFGYLYVAAKIPARIANATLTGAHADQFSNLIRRIWEIIPPDDDIYQIIDEALVQLKSINDVRASVAHFPSIVVSDKGRITTNVSRALTKERIREFRVSPEILATMTYDLKMIQRRLLYATIITQNPDFPREDFVSDIPSLSGAWRYKLSEDDNPKQTKQTKKDRR